MLRFISTFLLLLSPALSQRPLSPGRNPLMSGRFIYRAQPEEEQMWINYFNILDIPLTEELLAQGKERRLVLVLNHVMTFPLIRQLQDDLQSV